MAARFVVLLFVVAAPSNLFISAAVAHPASGIVMDAEGQVYFIYTRHGVMKIDMHGKLERISAVDDGHWLALDAVGRFSRAAPKYFQRITPDGVKPALIYAGGGAPLVVNLDGNPYYGSGDQKDSPGGLAVTRETPAGTRTQFSPELMKALHEIDGGVSGLAAGPDGSLYVACWTAIFKVKMDGTVTTLAHAIEMKDCDEDKADHNPTNRLPYLRGLAVDSEGTVYAAATSCHRLIKFTADRRAETALKTERPWTPTGVATHGRDVYVLEYTNANGPGTEGWRPRVRKLGQDGIVKILASISED